MQQAIKQHQKPKAHANKAIAAAILCHNTKIILSLKYTRIMNPISSLPLSLALILLLIVVPDPASATTGAPLVVAFAAKKKPNSKKKKNSASSQKGFGAAPPSLAEVCAKFQTRLPDNALDLPCPCGIDSKLYKDCCAPYHRSEAQAETPLRVLQSRYSAFTYRLVPYIIDSTHPTCRDYRENQQIWAQDLNASGMFDSFEFVQLQAGPEEYATDNADKATIDFKVRLRAKTGDQQETVVSEKSTFLKDAASGNVWTYASGQVRSDVEGLEDAILNR